jgi:hypothetical protein
LAAGTISPAHPSPNPHSTAAENVIDLIIMIPRSTSLKRAYFLCSFLRVRRFDILIGADTVESRKEPKIS